VIPPTGVRVVRIPHYRTVSSLGLGCLDRYELHWVTSPPVDECLSLLMDELTGCLDIYEEYIKLQTRIWGLELLHGYYE